MLILGIETSCDETSVALVEDGRHVRANYIASQVKLHAAFGGVVPELASRAHIQRLIPIIDACLRENNVSLGDIDAIAVTLGPGLVGALLVGVETAKALAFAAKKPLIPVQHVAAHLYSPFLYGDEASYRVIVLGDEENEDQEIAAELEAGKAQSPPGSGDAPLRYPYVGLAVSGGHSSLVRVDSPTHIELLGETVDDAAGEAFDKVAKLLELGYPGGPLIDRLAIDGNRKRFDLPRPMLNQDNFDFSFSGLKTAALGQVRELGAGKIKGEPQLLADFCASFQEAVVEVLLRKSAAAMGSVGVTQLAVVGGVACNSRLRSGVHDYLPHLRAVFPPPVMCTDNAAMVAGLAYHLRDQHPGCDLRLNAQADLPLA